MKEFSGGVPGAGVRHNGHKQNCEFLDDSGGVVTKSSSVGFDYPHESLIQLLQDHLMSGGDPFDFFLSFFNDEIKKREIELLKVFLQIPWKKINRDCILWVCGEALFTGLSVGKLARRHGLSKQAFQQKARDLEESLFLTPVRSQTKRDDEAREKMSRRTTRRCKV